MATPMEKPIQQILVVDDNAVLRRLLTTVLKLRGFQVMTAENGEVALEMLANGASSVSMMIVDVRMPRLDGIGVLKAVKQHHAEIPVVMLTIPDEADRADEARQLGAEDFLIKPVDPGSLMAVVERVIGHA